MHTALHLLERGDEVVGLDNLNDYYDVALKTARLDHLRPKPGFRFRQVSVEDRKAVESVFSEEKPQRVIHLAAQAGVRYSLVNPHAYIQSNIDGFLNILEGCRHHAIEHLAYASSSSVYGGNASMPFSEHDAVDHPVSLYAATKKANELMAHTYSHLFRLPTTGMRFFTVYGPWGRPDMALFLFTRAIFEGRPIDIFNGGDMARDFTYVDDVVDAVVRIVDKPATPSPAYDPAAPDAATSNAPYRVFNVGNSRPVALMRYIEALEKAIGREARKNFLPMQPGDVPATSADTSDLAAWVDFKPNTPVEVGVPRFVEWYRRHYGIQ